MRNNNNIISTFNSNCASMYGLKRFSHTLFLIKQNPFTEDKLKSIILEELTYLLGSINNLNSKFISSLFSNSFKNSSDLLNTFSTSLYMYLVTPWSPNKEDYANSVMITLKKAVVNCTSEKEIYNLFESTFLPD